MSMKTAWPYPCGAVHLSVVVRSDGDLSARLHRYTIDKNMLEMEKLLNKGVEVDTDSINHIGQTALFIAALLGRTAITKLLLQYGADPNHRCEDGSTAVHAAVFSCKPWLLHALLEAGGDLRLHDLDGRTPQDWLATAPEQHCARMVAFLHSLTFQVHQRLQSPVMKEHFHTSNSISRFFKCRGWDLNRFLGSKSSMSNQVPCRGFGKMCVDKVLGMSAPIPVIVDSDLTLDDDEAPFSFSCGSFISMTKCMWKDSRVTMKELIASATPASYLDLLLIEQDYCCQLPHSQLLQLVAVNLSDDLHRTRLVFERVHVGSLYNLLHPKQPKFPRQQAEDLLWTVVQVCEGLMFLHSGGLVMRALSSHSVLLTRPGLAKLTGLGFMVPSEGTCVRTAVSLALPPSLYNWAAPEVIQQEPCTWKADLYSLCALIQEIYTDMIPWGLAEPTYIKEVVDGGHALGPHWKVPQPHYDLIKMGLRARARDRRRSMQDLYDTMRSHGKKLPQEARQKCGLRAEPRDTVVASGCSPSPQHCATGTGYGVLSTALQPVVVETDGETETESAEIADRAARMARIRSNLKASRQLLLQANRSLDAVENALQLDMTGGTHQDVFIFPAVGPPPQYRLQPQGHPAVEKMEVELLTGEFTLLDQEELSFWLTRYPAEQNPFQEYSSPPPEHLSDRDADSSSSAFTSEGDGSGSQELTCDSRPLGDKWTVAAAGRHSRGPERRQRSQSPDQQPKAQPRCCVSSDTDCVEEEGHSLQPEPTTWTNYISELVARMTGCKMPGSSDSEEVDHNMQAACQSNQTCLGCRDHDRNPSTDPSTQKRTTEDESGTDTENSSVGETELDADFHTVNESFSQTCRVWDEEACPQEEGRHRSSIFYSANREENRHAADSSGTEEKNRHAADSSGTEEKNRHAADSSGTEEENRHAADSSGTEHNQHALHTDSPSTEAENQAAACLQAEWSNMSSVFYSANTEEKNQTAAGNAESQHSEDNQTCSEEEAADVTLEVCGPAASRTPPPGDTLDANNNQECVAVKNCEDDGAISAALASFPLGENITPPDLTELSSITCSPAHLQNRVPSPLYRIPPLYNSTPRSPAHHQHGVVRGSGVVIPYPDGSLDPSSCAHSRSGAVAFTTASSIFASSSTLQAPPIKAGSTSKQHPAGQGDTYSAVPPAGEGETYTTTVLAMEGEQQERHAPNEQSDEREEDAEEGRQGMPHREAYALEDEDNDGMDQVLCRDEEFGDDVSLDKGDCDLHPEEKWPALGVGSAEGTSLLEDTNRARSTLDEALQEEEGNQTSPWQSSLDCLDNENVP